VCGKLAARIDLTALIFASFGVEVTGRVVVAHIFGDERVLAKIAKYISLATIILQMRFHVATSRNLSALVTIQTFVETSVSLGNMLVTKIAHDTRPTTTIATNFQLLDLSLFRSIRVRLANRLITSRTRYSIGETIRAKEMATLGLYRIR